MSLSMANSPFTPGLRDTPTTTERIKRNSYGIEEVVTVTKIRNDGVVKEVACDCTEPHLCKQPTLKCTSERLYTVTGCKQDNCEQHFAC